MARMTWLSEILTSTDGCEQRSAGEMNDQVVSHESACRFAYLDGSAGMMRLHDHTVKIEKAVVNVGFVPEHVEAGAATGRFGQSITPTSLRNDRKGERRHSPLCFAQCARRLMSRAVNSIG
jgi:hypothetical protein